MRSYELSPGAREDLLSIALFTIDTWGIAQAKRYEVLLHQHMVRLHEPRHAGAIATKVALPNWPDLRVSRCEHHFVFSLTRTPNDMPPLIVAVFHEKMDLMHRLRHRLENDAQEEQNE